jgi:hypothetical protein
MLKKDEKGTDSVPTRKILIPCGAAALDRVVCPFFIIL